MGVDVPPNLPVPAAGPRPVTRAPGPPEPLLGTGLADGEGRLLWVDDGFCAILGLSRRQAVGTPLTELPHLGLGDFNPALSDRETVRLPSDETRPAVRLGQLYTPDGRPWAWDVELRGGTVRWPLAKRSDVGYFATDRDHLVVAVGGPDPAAFGLGSAAMGRRICDVLGSPSVHDLTERALAGRPAVGLAIQPTDTFELHLFPGRAAPGGVSGVVGVAVRLPIDAGSAVAPADEEWETDRRLDVAFGRKVRPLLESTADIVRRTLSATACGIFEYLPHGTGLVLRGAARQAPGPAETPPAAPAPAGVTSLVVPIDSPALTGCLVLSGAPDRPFTADDQRFAAAAAEMVGVAMALLAAGELDRQAALHDPVTGLPGRTLILDHLHRGVERAARRGTGVAVLFVDLARFKLINDTLGHKAGDDLLAAVGERMRAALRPSDTIGRLGGDEFLVICEDLTDAGDARGLAHRLIDTFTAPFSVAGVEVSVYAAAGVAYCRGPGLAGEALVAQADAAMYWAKRHGTTVAMFDEQVEAIVPDVSRLVRLLGNENSADHDGPDRG